MRILIVDDEKNLRKTTAEFLRYHGFATAEAENGLSGQKLLQSESFDCAVIDLKMPGMNGLELISWIKSQGPEIPVIMISAYGEVEDAVTAMKLGAADYMTKPVNPEELIIRLNKNIEEYRLKKLIHSDTQPGSGFPTENPEMRKVLTIAEKSAPTDAAVLVTGESGTGKEVLAKYIHGRSGRKKGPFIALNIGGINENLMESELFGYEKGAFTGADRRKLGLFELSAKGTLFLDEIGDIPLHLQVKLLRVLQEKSIQRLGGTGNIPVDFRLITATHRNLPGMIKSGDFREDLFYRLNVIHLDIPPLRKRQEDIPALASLLIRNIAEKMNIQVPALDIEVLDQMRSYPFPGNIREMENILERAVILSGEGRISAKDVSINIPRGESPDHLKGTLSELEKKAIIEALQRNEGHRQKTSDELGITRRTLLNKIKEYGIIEKKKCK